MTSKRPRISAEIKRIVLLEAGHRCAIPTCRTPVTEIAHIDPFRKVRKHEAQNLIALCPTCHTLFDQGVIERLSVKNFLDNGLICESEHIMSHTYDNGVREQIVFAVSLTEKGKQLLQTWDKNTDASYSYHG